MVVATVDAENRPHARNVLLRGIGSDRTLWFFTNRNSAKGVDLAANHAVGLLFSWLAQHRQIRVDGTAEPLTDDESDRYWSGRPRDSQISAWASAQSSVIAGRDVLEAKVAEGVERFGDGEVPRPPEWGGYGVSAVSFEFWQGRRSRLHDRLRYRRPVDRRVGQRRRLGHRAAGPLSSPDPRRSAPQTARRGDGSAGQNVMKGAQMSERPVALVTGASRGIGKAAALALADVGFDVAIAARTVREGDGRAEPNSIRDDAVVVVPGSLETTAAEIETRGARALIIPMDLLDRDAVVAAPATVLADGAGSTCCSTTPSIRAWGSWTGCWTCPRTRSPTSWRATSPTRSCSSSRWCRTWSNEAVGASSTWSRGPPDTTRPGLPARAGGASPIRPARRPSVGWPAASRPSSPAGACAPSTSTRATW